MAAFGRRRRLFLRPRRRPARQGPRPKPLKKGERQQPPQRPRWRPARDLPPCGSQVGRQPSWGRRRRQKSKAKRPGKQRRQERKRNGHEDGRGAEATHRKKTLFLINSLINYEEKVSREKRKPWKAARREATRPEKNEPNGPQPTPRPPQSRMLRLAFGRRCRVLLRPR